MVAVLCTNETTPHFLEFLTPLSRPPGADGPHRGRGHVGRHCPYTNKIWCGSVHTLLRYRSKPPKCIDSHSNDNFIAPFFGPPGAANPQKGRRHIRNQSTSACKLCYQWNVGGGLPRACTLNTALSPELILRGSTSVRKTGLLSSISKPRPMSPVSTTHTTVNQLLVYCDCNRILTVISAVSITLVGIIGSLKMMMMMMTTTVTYAALLKTHGSIDLLLLRQTLRSDVLLHHGTERYVYFISFCLSV